MVGFFLHGWQPAKPKLTARLNVDPKLNWLGPTAR